MAVDPKTVATVAKAVKDKVGGDNFIIILVVSIVGGICLLVFPIYVILHPIEALSIAKGDSEVTVEYLGYIAGKYETGNSDPGCISSGAGDYRCLLDLGCMR